MASALAHSETWFSRHTILSQIGNTPLVFLPRLSAETPGVEIYAKDESRNPGGSVKDRPALNMILRGEREGKLVPGKIILEATSGNTGIGLAYGADVVYTPGGEGSDGAIRRAKQIFAESPDEYFYPDQYNNPANWQAHYETTAPEILRQTMRRITHFVTGLGTSGTCMGVTRRFRDDAPHVRCFSMQPDSAFHGLEGLKHMETAIVPGIYDPHLTDGNIEIDTEAAHRMVLRVAREEGKLIGVSAGANLAAAMKIAQECSERRERAVVVTLICDDASKYLSEHFWDDSN
jgi:cysteine synthase B